MNAQAYVDAIESLASAIEKLPEAQYIPGHIVIGIRYDGTKHKYSTDLKDWRVYLDKYFTAVGGYGGMAGIPYTCAMVVTGPAHLRALAAHLKPKLGLKWLAEVADRTEWVNLIPTEVKLPRPTHPALNEGHHTGRVKQTLTSTAEEEEITEVQLFNMEKDIIRAKQLRYLPKEESNNTHVDAPLRFQQFIDSLGIQQAAKSARGQYIAIKLNPSDYDRVAECNFLYSIRRMGILTLRKSQPL